MLFKHIINTISITEFRRGLIRLQPYFHRARLNAQPNITPQRQRSPSNPEDSSSGNNINNNNN